ncbi:hypothetical protein EDEG_01063 [Edhazardia aedis USNM 41457]|uniref:ABC transporter domain-containing protein n=1 Tax=Edhazardia aedis (strain USNM 41457) TaxID=1003232 RepID=J8ZYM3_EDHAE|nr:hypothetical protein EDEG_01063 [Edhazardia aedis USNM 41457]|eukprot:EJW04773.1 hypothetical protein EDEG_01063 [Edhazardia aedis USNM 41457]
MIFTVDKLSAIATYRKKKKKLLDNISFKASSGQIVALTGESGSGKTTLLNICFGQASSKLQVEGKILVDNKARNYSDWRKMAGYVPQSENVDKNEKVYDYLETLASLRNPNFSRSKIKEMVDEQIDIFDLEHVRNIIIGKISGGERKRTAIAGVMLSDPQILFLDEPLSCLDSLNSKNIMNYLRYLATEYNKIIFISVHRVCEDIMMEFDKIIYLASSKQFFVGSYEDLKQKITDMNVELPAGISVAEFMSLLTTKKKRFLEISDYSRVRNNLIESFAAENSVETDEQINEIKSCIYFGYVLSFWQIITLIKRLYRKKISNLSSTLGNLFLKVSIIYVIAVFSSFINDSEFLEEVFQKYIYYGSYAVIFGMYAEVLLSFIWNMISKEIYRVKYETSIFLFTPITYMVYVLCATTLYMLIFQILAFPAFYWIQAEENPKDFIVVLLLHFFPFQMLLSIGLVFLCIPFRPAVVLIYLNRFMSFLAICIMSVLNVVPQIKTSNEFVNKSIEYLRAAPIIFPFISMRLMFCEKLMRLLQPFLDKNCIRFISNCLTNAKKFVSNDLISGENLFIYSKILFVLWFISGLIVFYLVLCPVYKI